MNAAAQGNVRLRRCGYVVLIFLALISPWIPEAYRSWQVDRATEAGCLWLLERQEPDGRFSDPENQNLSDLGATSLALLVLKRNYNLAFEEPRFASAIEDAQRWLERKQITEGPFRGLLGHPDRPAAWEEQGMAMVALLERGISQSSRESMEHFASLLQSEAVRRDFSAEEAFWWSRALALARPLSRRLDLDETTKSEFDRAVGTSRGRLRRAILEEPRASSHPAIAYDLGKYRAEETERVSMLESAMRGTTTTAYESDPKSIAPLELFALASVISRSRFDESEPDFGVSRRWIRALRSEQVGNSSTEAGSWEPLAAPFDSRLSATVITLLILGQLPVE